MLDQDSDEPLNGAESYPVDHNGTVLLPVRSGVLQPEPQGQLEVQLNGAALPGTSQRILQMEDTVVHGVTDEESAPHIISVGVGGVRSEVLLHTLEDKGICVSSGSACSSNHPAVSGVLKAIGAPREYLDATVRFSMSEFTTKEEIDYTLETLYNCIPMLRKFTRR